MYIHAVILMGLVPLSDGNTSGSFDYKDLPWVNVFGKSVKDLDLTYIVYMVLSYDSGLMVITHDFKSYIYAGSKAYTDLLEALDAFTDLNASTNVLVAKVTKRNKAELFMDDEIQNARWHKVEERYVQVLKGDCSIANKPSKNPFMAGMGVLLKPLPDGIISTPEEVNGKTDPAASRKGRKPVEPA